MKVHYEIFYALCINQKYRELEKVLSCEDLVKRVLEEELPYYKRFVNSKDFRLDCVKICTLWEIYNSESDCSRDQYEECFELPLRHYKHVIKVEPVKIDSIGKKYVHFNKLDDKGKIIGNYSVFKDKRMESFKKDQVHSLRLVPVESPKYAARPVYELAYTSCILDFNP